jgi:hypothetical protein
MEKIVRNKTGPIYVEIQGVKVLTLTGGLYSVGFINPIGVVAGVRRWRLAFYWAHLSRFRPKTEKKSSFRNVVF